MMLLLLNPEAGRHLLNWSQTAKVVSIATKIFRIIFFSQTTVIYNIANRRFNGAILLSNAIFSHDPTCFKKSVVRDLFQEKCSKI